VNGDLTRLKLVISGCILFGLEAGIRGLWGAFPFLELVSAQGGLILAYLGAKSFTTNAVAKYNCGASKLPAGEAEGK
jgi:hypothetical protein